MRGREARAGGKSFNDPKVAIRKRPDHSQHPRALVIEPRSRHFGWRRGSTANWGRSRRDRGCAGSRTENVADNAASRRPGPSRGRTLASSSATPTGRRLPMFISRRSRGGARQRTCSPATRRDASRRVATAWVMPKCSPRRRSRSNMQRHQAARISGVVNIRDAHQFNNGVMGAYRPFYVVRRDEVFVTLKAEVDHAGRRESNCVIFCLREARGRCHRCGFGAHPPVGGLTGEPAVWQSNLIDGITYPYYPGSLRSM
jgi:hypothetical protein